MKLKKIKVESAIAPLAQGSAKVLVLDIETAPIAAAVWRIWQENVGLNQISRDWYILSFSAKWLGSDEVFYIDQRDVRNPEDDSALLRALWKLLDEADYVIAHNGQKFDVRKIFARMIIKGIKPPSPFKVIDTLLIAKRAFGFTSNKLEYIADKLNKKYKKLKHDKFPGYELWRAVLAGNRDAWNSMEEYNVFDVLSLEEVYGYMRPWDDKHPNVHSHNDHDDDEACPICGGHHLIKKGHRYTTAGKYQRYQCADCNSWSRGRYTVNTLRKRKATLTV